MGDNTDILLGTAGSSWMADALGVGEPERVSKPPSPTASRAEAEKDAQKAIERRRKLLAQGGRQSTIHSFANVFGSPSAGAKELLGD